MSSIIKGLNSVREQKKGFKGRSEWDTGMPGHVPADWPTEPEGREDDERDYGPGNSFAVYLDGKLLGRLPGVPDSTDTRSLQVYRDFLAKHGGAGKWEVGVSGQRPDHYSIIDLIRQARKDKEQGVAEGSESSLWRVEKSEATGRYYAVKGYNKSRKVWKNKMGAGDFNSKEDAQRKVDELNKGVAEAGDISFPADRMLENLTDQFKNSELYSGDYTDDRAGFAKAYSEAFRFLRDYYFMKYETDSLKPKQMTEVQNHSMSIAEKIFADHGLEYKHEIAEGDVIVGPRTGSSAIYSAMQSLVAKPKKKEATKNKGESLEEAHASDDYARAKEITGKIKYPDTVNFILVDLEPLAKKLPQDKKKEYDRAVDRAMRAQINLESEVFKLAEFFKPPSRFAMEDEQQTKDKKGFVYSIKDKSGQVLQRFYSEKEAVNALEKLDDKESYKIVITRT